MGWLRRATLSIGTAVSLLATMTIAAVAAGGGFGQGPGHFTFHDTNAFANFFNPDGSNANVSIDRGTFMFRPKGGGGLQTQMMTVMTVSAFVPNPDPTMPPLFSDSACFVIPPPMDATALVVGSDLQTATLDAMVDSSNECPFFLVPVTGAQPSTPFAPGPPPPGPPPPPPPGFTFPLHVTALWIGTGLVGTAENQGSSKCGGFVSVNHSHQESAFSSSVTLTISGVGTFSGSPSPTGPFAFGNVSISEFSFDVAGSGILPPGCGGKGG